MIGATRVVLADDHPLIRSGIRTVLAATDDIVLIGEAADGDKAQRRCRELKPDVLLLDLCMPGPPSHEIIAYLQAHCPQVKVIVLTAINDVAVVRQHLASGAAGYVLKDEPPEALLRAIRVVLQGDRWLSWSIMEMLAQPLGSSGASANEPELTKRERQLLNLIARGWDNSRIAAELNLAEQTVRNYASRIYLTLGLTSRAETIVWARERGFAGGLT